MKVEDHPLDYGTFEGTIPKGEYGGGTVQLWDQGTWRPQSGNPERDLARGNLKVCFEGKRMHGGWALIRLRDREQDLRRKARHNWLLIKENDEYAQPGEPDALASETTSVKTGRTLEEIASRSRNVWHSNRSQKEPEPAARPRAAPKRAKAPAQRKRPMKAKPPAKKKLRKR
jgi:bifunctional non-homologous end joining protein LigD